MGPLSLVLHVVFLVGGMSGQNISPLSIQAALNSFCFKHPNTAGCTTKDTGSGNTSTATGKPDELEPCSTSSRLCSDLPNCVPKNIPCNVIRLNKIRCNLPPTGGRIVTLVLQCGDGSTAGIRCNDENFQVPMLTQLLVQCDIPYLSHIRDIPPITQLGEVSVFRATGGAGVYLCGQFGSWDPLFDSPSLDPLISSCNSAGCGRVPMPRVSRPIHRGWPWVRALYYQDKIHCTATLVSPTAALTAAHCLTSSAVSRTTLDPQSFIIELPGPQNQIKKQIFSIPTSLHIHPHYNPQRGRQHDTAVIKFAPPGTYSLPTVCLNEEATVPGSREQVVFGLQPGFLGGIKREPPFWRTVECTRDSTCLTIGIRTASSCADSLVVQPFQFCASHPGLSMRGGSSGGPFLMEVGTSVEEVWQVVGVLSYFSNESACNQGHSVYNHVTEDSKWIQRCVFSEKCS